MNDTAPKFSKLWPKSRKGFAVAQRLCKNYAAHYDCSSRRRLKRSSTYYVPTTKETHPCAVVIRRKYENNAYDTFGGSRLVISIFFNSPITHNFYEQTAAEL